MPLTLNVKNGKSDLALNATLNGGMMAFKTLVDGLVVPTCGATVTFAMAGARMVWGTARLAAAGRSQRAGAAGSRNH